MRTTYFTILLLSLQAIAFITRQVDVIYVAVADRSVKLRTPGTDKLMGCEKEKMKKRKLYYSSIIFNTENSNHLIFQFKGFTVSCTHDFGTSITHIS